MTSYYARLRDQDVNGAADIIVTGAGDDVADGELGDDTLSLGEGSDIGVGSAGADILNGGGGDDDIAGLDGGDMLFGDAGADLQPCVCPQPDRAVAPRATHALPVGSFIKSRQPVTHSAL